MLSDEEALNQKIAFMNIYVHALPDLVAGLNICTMTTLLLLKAARKWGKLRAPIPLL